MSVWNRVKREMPKADAELPRNWGGFAGAALGAAALTAAAFPFKLAAEIAKAADKPPKANRKREARDLFEEARSLSLKLPDPAEFAESVLAPLDVPDALRPAVLHAIRGLYADSAPLNVPPAPADLEALEAIRWRASLSKAVELMRGDGAARMRRACAASIEALLASLPKIAGKGELSAPLKSLSHPGKLADALIAPLDAELFPAFAERYAENALRISGIDPKRPKPGARIARPRDLDDPEEFFQGTPLAGLLSAPVPIEIPQEARFSHHWIVAPPETGKTNAFRYLIGKDLERAARGECSVVVIDHQAQLISEISRMKLFAPGQPLHGKLCLVDASDAEFPVAMNFFDLGESSSSKMLLSALEMYEFLLGSLLQQEMSPRQATMFSMIALVMFAKPGADIETFHDFVLTEPPHKPGDRHKYQDDIDRTHASTRQYFATTYVTDPLAKSTREQVSARMWSLRRNDAFMRMFSADEAKVRFADLIDAPGSVILVNTSKDDLGEQGCGMLGRFFVALLKQAAERRAPTTDKGSLTPCFCYVDECHNYVKDNPRVSAILEEARQQRIGLVLAHQHLYQVGTTTHALGTVGIKMASNVSAEDRPKMARELETVPNFIADQPQGSFAISIRFRLKEAISIRFPLDWFKRFERMSPDEREAVIAHNREKYAAAAKPAKAKAKSTGRQRRNPDAP